MSIINQIDPKKQKLIKSYAATLEKHGPATTPCVDHGQKGVHGGYGNLSFAGKKTAAHRVVYAIHYCVPLEMLQGTVIRHTCDNPRCINPYHLLAGTHADNMRDKAVRGRAAQPHRRLLTMDQAREIRRLYTPGRPGPGNKSPHSIHGLARKYGVKTGTINNILVGRSYREPT